MLHRLYCFAFDKLRGFTYTCSSSFNHNRVTCHPGSFQQVSHSVWTTLTRQCSLAEWTCWHDKSSNIASLTLQVCDIAFRLKHAVKSLKVVHISSGFSTFNKYGEVFGTWATAWGAPVKAAVETTLTAPPPSSLPSSCGSVTWTTRYVTCKVKRETVTREWRTEQPTVFHIIYCSPKHKCTMSRWILYLTCRFVYHIYFFSLAEPNI